MKVPVEIDHVEFQIYGSGVTTQVDFDTHGNNAVSLTAYYADEKDSGYAVQDRFSIYIDNRGRIVMERTQLVPAFDENGSPWDKKGNKLEPHKIITTEVLKDYSVGK